MSVCSQVPITNFFKRSSNVIEKQNCSSEHKSCEASTVNTNPSFDNAEFPFPFTPYKIQVDFMKELYHTLQEGKIGIFESPTGTVSISQHYSLCIQIQVYYGQSP